MRAKIEKRHETARQTTSSLTEEDWRRVDAAIVNAIISKAADTELTRHNVSLSYRSLAAALWPATWSAVSDGVVNTAVRRHYSDCQHSCFRVDKSLYCNGIYFDYDISN